MAVCWICKPKRSFLNLKKLFKHLKDIHGDVTVYKCRQNDCNRIYSKKKCFVQHYKREHGDNSSSILEDEQITQEIPDHCNSINVSEMELPPVPEPDFSDLSSNNDLLSTENVSDTNPSNPKKDMHELLLDFLISLYSHGSIPRNQVQNIIETLSSLILSITDTLKIQVENAFCSIDDKQKIDSIFSGYDNIFEKFGTEFKRFKEFEKSNLLIKPVPYFIGQFIGQKKVGNKRIPMPLRLEGHHMPLKKVFELFFNRKNVLKSILDYQHLLLQDTETLSNFIQGEFWRKKIATDSRTLIPFFIYNDDYEAGNPLSSHSGIHKICGTYASLPTLPPQFRSKLDSIFITLLFHSADRKKFGNKRTFSILINEIDEIHRDGIHIETDDFKGTIFPVLVLLVADNLGVHSVCGFSESFTCTYPCHVCKMTIDQVRTYCVEDSSLLRNKEKYAADLAKKDLSLTGIKEECIWNKIEGFHVTENVSLDLTHDMFCKGVCTYVLVSVLQHLVSSEICNLQFINDRLDLHDFGPLDSANRPLAIRAEELSSGKLRMTASETLNFTIHLGLMIGDRVPYDDPFWLLYSNLRKVLDIILAPSLSRKSIESLSSAVEELNSLYLFLTETNLKNKFHHLIHYENHIKKYGPPVHTWTNPFERKHKQSKTAAYAILCRKNTTLSLGIKHQLQMMSVINSEFKDADVEVSPKGFWINSKEIDFLSGISVAENLPDDLFCTEWVKYNGTRYVEGLALIFELEENNPVFSIIQSIYLSEYDHLYFVCLDTRIIKYSKHLHAYNIEIKSESKSLRRVENLKIHTPCAVSLLSSDEFFITLRHKW